MLNADALNSADVNADLKAEDPTLLPYYIYGVYWVLLCSKYK